MRRIREVETATRAAERVEAAARARLQAALASNEAARGMATHLDHVRGRLAKALARRRGEH